MKKQPNKLALKTQTIRSLSGRSLDGVVGGWDPNLAILMPAYRPPGGSHSGGVSCEGQCSG